MKLRLICKESNSAHVVYGGASQATEEYKTFEMGCPLEIDEWLSLVEGKSFEYQFRWIVGVEVVKD